MPFFWQRPKPKAPEPEEVGRLQAEIRRLQEEVAFLRAQNARLSQESAPALRENAVLRYELFKCQSDRQVLEFHLTGVRAELGGTLALLRRLAPGEPPAGEPILQAFLDLMEAGRRLGVDLSSLSEAEGEARAALEAPGAPRPFQPERFLLLRLLGVLAALEGLLGQEIRQAEHAADALAQFPEALERVRRALGEVLPSLYPREP